LRTFAIVAGDAERAAQPGIAAPRPEPDDVPAWDETQRSRFTAPSLGCDGALAVELGA
jgi:hypothetical protein